MRQVLPVFTLFKNYLIKAGDPIFLTSFIAHFSVFLKMLVRHESEIVRNSSDAIKENQRNLLFSTRYADFGGERGIRTPGTSRYAGFQDRCNRPLYHLSKTYETDFLVESDGKGRHFSAFAQIFGRQLCIFGKKRTKNVGNEEKSGKKKEERRRKEGGISRKSGKRKKQKKEKKQKKGVGLRLTGHDAGSNGHGDGLFPYIGFGEIHQSAIGIVGAP